VNGEISVDLKRMIEITLTENGLGAKTALGYGRFATYVP
jgi:CRISPR/Cas system CMR subunit Cmr6 (Cas7 group RAMP superfamily)